MSPNVRKRTLAIERQAKIQIRLRICAVWSESSLGAFWIAKATKLLHVDNEDSDQTARMRWLIWVSGWVHMSKATISLFAVQMSVYTGPLISRHAFLKLLKNACLGRSFRNIYLPGDGQPCLKSLMKLRWIPNSLHPVSLLRLYVCANPAVLGGGSNVLENWNNITEIQVGPNST